ncbi:MAG TPA: hypothetical protein DCK95_05300 [Anaerolineaceae bacterium]|uniref:Secretion protein HlyD family protein n=1 Tax=Anaerolinea thermophila TaxID=167964 RepID=A0A117LH57_9CHLR|nr:MAG: Secretion protein HlyD family protein [Anaerolinea thermophila]HAF61722.1 hypothetical protein [Anaerolineaceae bacterium]
MSEEKKNKKSKKYYYYAAAIILIIIIIFSNRNKDDSGDELITTTVEMGELIATVGGTGKVEANKSAFLTWDTTGNVSEVYVENGTQVTQGTTLAELAPASLPQSVILAKADLVDAQRNLENVLQSDTQRSQIYLDLLDAEQNYKDAQEDVDAWNYNNADQQSVDQARAEFIAAEETLKQIETSLQSVQNGEENGDVQALQEKLDEAQLTRDKALRNLSSILGKTYSTTVAKDFAEYDLAEAQLDDIQREWDRVKDGKNEDDILAAQAKVIAAESVTDMAVIKAPFDGTITSVFTKVGDEVNAGLKAFRVDDLSTFYIEVEIPEIDINRIEIGQEAEFTFDSILDKTYHGKVVDVAGAGSEEQGETNFIVKIILIDGDSEILPGMTASVSITVTKLEDVLIVPTRAIRLENGDIVVYALRNGNIEKVIIEIGASSDSYTQIISGEITENETLVLNPPEDLFNTNQRPAFTR